MLCYPNYGDGYYGIGPVCWGICPPNTSDADVDNIHICPTKTYKSGALCYPDCKSNFEGDGPVCWSICPYQEY